MRQRILIFQIKIRLKYLEIKRKDFLKLKNQKILKIKNKFLKYYEKSKEYFKAKKLEKIFRRF